MLAYGMPRTEGSKKFRKFLKAKGVSIRGAVEALQVSIPTVVDWRNGKKSPTHEHRVAICTWTNGTIAEDDWKTARERRRAKKIAKVTPFVEESPPKSEPVQSGRRATS